jgi:hypothetical protein
VYRDLVILSILAIGFGLVTEEQSAAWVAGIAIGVTLLSVIGLLLMWADKVY